MIVAQTSPFLPTDSHESTSNPQSPKLIFDIEDAHLTTITSHFDYGHLENETVVSKKTGTVPTTPKGILEVPLCAGTFGAAFQTPGAQHQVAIWVTDSAGNPSKPITVQFTVTWETPPLWVGPSQAPLDKWDLASYSFDDFTIHKPFATQANDGSSMYGYRIFRYGLINPHPIPIKVSLSSVSDLTLEQGMRRAYVHSSSYEWKPGNCPTDQCAYLYFPYAGEQSFPNGAECGYKATFNSQMWASVPTKVKVWLWVPEKIPQLVSSNTGFTIPPHSTASIAWTIHSMNTCLVPPPTEYMVGGTTSILFYQVSNKSCDEYGEAGGGVGVAPFTTEPYGGLAACTAKHGADGSGATYYLPFVLMSLRTRIAESKSTKPTVLNLAYAAESATTKVFVATHSSDVLWTDTLESSKFLKSVPYYILFDQ